MLLNAELMDVCRDEEAHATNDIYVCILFSVNLTKQEKSQSSNKVYMYMLGEKWYVSVCWFLVRIVQSGRIICRITCSPFVL
jgi:hypothetical protein